MKFFFTIVLFPIIFLYCKSLFLLFGNISLLDTNQISFWLPFLISTLLSFIYIKGDSFLAIFEHELTHNIWAIITLNKPVGFHVTKGRGGLFEYKGRGNVLITLSPYFFHTFSFLILPLYFFIRPYYYLYFFIFLGVLTGYHTSSTIKEFSYKQPDIKKNGFFFSTVFIILGNIICYGILIAFTIDSWGGVNKFLGSGIKEIFGLVKCFL